MSVVNRNNGAIPIVLRVANLCNDLFTDYNCRNIETEFVRSCNCFRLCYGESSQHNDDGHHGLRHRISNWPASRG